MHKPYQHFPVLLKAEMSMLCLHNAHLTSSFFLLRLELLSWSVLTRTENEYFFACLILIVWTARLDKQLTGMGCQAWNMSQQFLRHLFSLASQTDESSATTKQTCFVIIVGYKEYNCLWANLMKKVWNQKCITKSEVYRTWMHL